jgi:hypothetical protein
VDEPLLSRKPCRIQLDTARLCNEAVLAQNEAIPSHWRIARKPVLAHDVPVRIDPRRNGKNCARIIYCGELADPVSHKSVRMPVDPTFIATDNGTGCVNVQSSTGSGIGGINGDKGRICRLNPREFI